MAMKFDGVAEPSTGYDADVDFDYEHRFAEYEHRFAEYEHEYEYEHEHEHEHETKDTPERWDATERRWRGSSTTLCQRQPLADPCRSSPGDDPVRHLTIAYTLLAIWTFGWLAGRFGLTPSLFAAVIFFAPALFCAGAYSAPGPAIST